NSDWNFSASVQYGRSSRKQYRHEENRAGAYLNPPIHFEYIYGTAGIINQTADYSAKSNESHAIVDFAVGKDVGLGLWKQSVSSQISFGVRFAQFTAKSSINLRGDPYPHRSGFKYFTPSHASIPFNAFRQYYKATPEMSRSFRGWGPSISWNGSVPVINPAGKTPKSRSIGVQMSASYSVAKRRTFITTLLGTYIRFAHLMLSRGCLSIPKRTM